MPSYKRIYIFAGILYIISSKNCIFKTHEIGGILKREEITYLSHSTLKKYLVDTDTILTRTTLSIS